jgi:hypothetical protein
MNVSSLGYNVGSNLPTVKEKKKKKRKNALEL